MRFLVSEKLGPHKYKTPEGYLVCVDAILGRTGTQEYRRRELFGDACDDPDEIVFVDRKAEEVFSDKTMASFENKPICIEHPDSSVNAENYNELSVGFVRDIHRGEDNGVPVMMGTLVITDKEAVEAVERGEYKELSCGYDCDITDEPSPQQRNIRGNHVALCKQGRAGIARIVDSVVDDKDSLMNDAKLSAKQRNEISSYLSSISKYTKHDPDIIDLILPLKHKGYEIFRKNIKGWYKTSEGTMRKDYFFGINGYDNTFMISMYADERDWKVNEVNAYFIDSADILLNKEKEMKTNFEDSMQMQDTFTDELSYYGNSWDRLVKKIVPKDRIVSIGTILGRGRSAVVEGKEYAEALKKATLSEGKTKVYVKPYGSYENLFEVYFTDSAQTQDTFTDEYVKDEALYYVQIKEKIYNSWFTYYLSINGSSIDKHTDINKADKRPKAEWERLLSGRKLSHINEYKTSYLRAPDAKIFNLYFEPSSARGTLSLNDVKNGLQQRGVKIISTVTESYPTRLGTRKKFYVFKISEEYADIVQQYVNWARGSAEIGFQRPNERQSPSDKKTLYDAETFTVEYVKDNVIHIVEIEATSLEDAILKAKNEYVKDNKFIGEGIVTRVYGDRFGHKFDVSVAGKVYKFVTQNNIASTGAASKNDKVKVYRTDGGSIVFVLK